MICTLCCATSEDLIIFSNVEGKIGKIINKYFPFCFKDESKDGLVCEQCWLKVEMFHEFYIRIEAIHFTEYKNDNIFVNNIDWHFNITMDEEKSLIPCIKNLDQKRTDDNVFSDIYSNESDYFPEEPPSKQITLKKSKCKANRAANKQKTKERKPTETKKEIKHRQNDKNRTFQCEFCKTHFLSDGNLQRHIKQFHLVFQFKCAEFKCVDSFETSDQLNEHVIKNHSRDECPHCSKMIRTIRMSEHIKSQHDNVELFVCDLCGKIFRSKHLHKYHIQRKHTEHQKVQCDICGTWLKHKDSLKIHMKIRHIQGPQTCGICGKVSPNRKALAKHKKVHLADTKERFKCIVCGNGFRDRTKLKEHSYIHSGITDAYRCNYCDKTFRFGSSMYAHRKKAHSGEEQLRLNGSC